jgi:preprotein translocase subunit SecA
MASFRKSVQEMLNPSKIFLEKNKTVVEQIMEMDFSDKSDIGLRGFAGWLRERFKEVGEARAGEYLVPCFALAREALRRATGLSAYETQVMAGIALYEGKLIEMYTGEGKTLSGVMPAVMYGLMGHRVHMITFNDYLVERDCEWMRGAFERLGLTVGCIVAETSMETRREMYMCDILYITLKECGFDYLRDFLATTKEELIQRRYQYAIIDEADSMLIDEARVPLVIAGDVPYTSNLPKQAAQLAKKLKESEHFILDKFNNNVSFTQKGILAIEKILGIANLYDEENMEIAECIQNALKAEHMLKENKDYIIKDQKILIVDEFTGRVVENRHYPDGLQSAVEIKEGIPNKASGMIMSQITIQYFIRMYKKLCGMTGTAVTSAQEFYETYGLQIVEIPPYKPNIRKDREDNVYSTKDAKMRAVITETINQHSSGRPILIGTTTVEESEWLAKELLRSGVFTQVLNARQDEDEAKIIQKAGVLGTVTVSTNMAGRGVDIKLGGEKAIQQEKIKQLGGLYVIGTNHYESRRIDNQLRGRAGRQGDPGETHFFVSIEDELMQKFGLEKLLPRYVLQYSGTQIVRDKRVTDEIEHIQRIAEGYYRDMRTQLSKYSQIIDDQRRAIHAKHYEILRGTIEPRLLAQRNPEKALRLQRAYGKEKIALIERQLILFFMNRYWAEYLEQINDLRQGIHLVVIGGKEPIDEFRREAINMFTSMHEEIDRAVVDAFDTAVIGDNGVDFQASNIKRPTTTWTYLIDESADQFSRLPDFIRKLSGEQEEEDYSEYY